MKNPNQNKWDRFLQHFPDAHLLQTGAWGELKSAFGWKAVHVVGERAGAQVLFRPLPFGFSWGYIARGPVGHPDDGFWSLIEAQCRRHRAVFLKIEPDTLEDPEVVRPFLPATNRCRVSPHTIQPRRTLVVELAGSEDELLGRMKQKTRYNIRLSQRKGVEVRYGENVGSFYQLLEETGQRDEFGIHSEAYYQRAYDLFSARDACAMVFAEFEGKLLSAAMVFAHGTRSWYFYGASSNEHRNLMAPYAVQWEAMRWARAKGCSQYDLWGVPDEDGEVLEAEFSNRNDGLWGVYRFKRGFGGELVRGFGAWDVVYHPVLYNFYLQWVKKREI